MKLKFKYFNRFKKGETRSVVARSKAWVCGRSFAGIAGSNPARDMDVCLL
jgi:hypothetical protein